MPLPASNSTKAGKRKNVAFEMHKFKGGSLHSGSDKGPKVKDRKQAVAIAMHQAGMSKDKKARNKRLADKEL